MIAAILILDLSLKEEYQGAKVEALPLSEDIALPSEAGVFKRSSFALDYQAMPQNVEHERILTAYYRNRAYPGAPPVIPHAILDEHNIGDKSCLQCHQNGGYVDQFKAFAPVTPHPEFINCKQCHVPVRSNVLFRESSFQPAAPAETNQQALVGSPPVIPHPLPMRENCLACHAGPAAPKEIRVTHPERVNCRQCHAVKPVADVAWVRTPTE